MDPTDVCPNCGRPFPHSVDHRCSANEEGMINQIDDNEDSTLFLKEVVKESKSFDESAYTSVERSDFTESGMEELKENTLEQTEDEYESTNLNLLRDKNPLISEGNPFTPPNEERSTEETQEDTFEGIYALDEYFENVFEFLDTDTTLYSNEPIPIVLQHGNPLDGLPFETLVTDDSSDSNQRLDKNVKSTFANQMQSTSSNDSMAKLVSNLRLNTKSVRKTTSKGDSGHLNPSSLLESKKHQNRPEGASVVLPGSSQSEPSTIDCREHSETVSRNEPLKHKTKRTFLCDQYGNILSSKRDHEYHMSLHENQNTSGKFLVALPSGTQDCPSKPELGEHSRTETKKSPLKHSPEKTFLCDRCGRLLSSRQSFRNHGLLHTEQKSFVCKECGKAFATSVYLKNHTRTHTGERPYECSLCGKRFIQANNRNSHFRTHTGEQPFKCEGCGRSFSHQSNYHKHRHSHCKHRRSHTT